MENLEKLVEEHDKQNGRIVTRISPAGEPNFSDVRGNRQANVSASKTS
ncbi:hypothetical protein MiSe_95120 [Microseira wollei NIES-4236]|uniref:Uncharacterized protein n=1 Tax=Microseira wollei NIES-4236 TaxID=2530354 RepID=A0AAV3WQZ0_9CYAN|nr:hypothetical protein MiSe_95120 [Microseira wollei NIES-4236]